MKKYIMTDRSVMQWEAQVDTSNEMKYSILIKLYD
jgi:hypothetical protein